MVFFIIHVSCSTCVSLAVRTPTKQKALSAEHETRGVWSLKYVSRCELTGETCLVEAMASVDAGLGVLVLILTMKRKRGLKFCTVPGLGLLAQIIFGFGPGPNESNQTFYRIFRAFSGHSFLAKKKLFVVALILCSWHSWASETNPTHLIFSRIFVAYHSQIWFEITAYKLGIRYLCTVPQTPK
jgi:hypothetical protein